MPVDLGSDRASGAPSGPWRGGRATRGGVRGGRKGLGGGGRWGDRTASIIASLLPARPPSSGPCPLLGDVHARLTGWPPPV